MITWPVAVIVCCALLFGYALLDTWLKQPLYHRRVGNVRVTMRGEEARAAIRRFCDETARDAAAAGTEPPEHFQRAGASSSSRRH